ncbi:MAG: motility protein MotB [Alphaproteobacteria bacterium]|nr:MAG: motility protein MotB [Alphaproteobacteria bacterium]
MAAKDERPIVIKKVKKVAGGHHGGAWKVAYADFVTAMMAFFMLLWLLNVSEKETLQGLADYFTPSNASMSNASGAGDILAGTALESEGAKASGAIAGTTPSTTVKEKETHSKESAQQQDWNPQVAAREDRALAQLESQIKAAIQETPELSQHQDQLIIEQTPEGLRIQLIDKDGRPMFRQGSAEMYRFAARMLETIAGVIQTLPNRMAISGHTDALPNRGNRDYTNWELSADRANAARRVLANAGVSRDRFSEVTGKAATEPLFPDAPLRPENKRISILLLREAPVIDPAFGAATP